MTACYCNLGLMLIESYNIDIQYRQHLPVPKIYGCHYTTTLQLVYIAL